MGDSLFSSLIIWKPDASAREVILPNSMQSGGLHTRDAARRSGGVVSVLRRGFRNELTNEKVNARSGTQGPKTTLV